MIANTGVEIAGHLTLAICPDLETNLQRLFTTVRREAALARVEHRRTEARDALKENCPYTLSQLLDGDSFPGNG